MSIDLAALTGRGRTLVEQAIATSGTKVTITRDLDDLDATVDFDTLEISDATSGSTVATNVSVLIVVEGPDVESVGPDRDSHPPSYRALFKVATVNVAEGDVLIVTASRDPHLKGGRLLVTAVLDDSMNVVRTVRARRV